MMKRRAVLDRLAAGAVTVVGLAGTSTATSTTGLETLRGTEFIYRKTATGLEKVRVDGSFETTDDDCTTDRCCTCPDECQPECWCLEPC